MPPTQPAASAAGRGLGSAGTTPKAPTPKRPGASQPKPSHNKQLSKPLPNPKKQNPPKPSTSKQPKVVKPRSPEPSTPAGKSLASNDDDDGFLLGSDEDEDADGDMLGDWGGYNGLTLSVEPPLELVRTRDKNRLKPKLRMELSRRLRREESDLSAVPGQMHIMRVYRFGLDDLRLYQAVHEAHMEGRIVVVDDPSLAHVVLASQKSRTGRDITMENAMNLASNMNIPFIKLERISGKRLMEALAPLMGMAMPPHLLIPKAPKMPILREAPEQIAQVAQVLMTLQQPVVTVTPAQLQGQHHQQVAALPLLQQQPPVTWSTVSTGQLQQHQRGLVSSAWMDSTESVQGSVQGSGSPQNVTIGELMPRLRVRRKGGSQPAVGAQRRSERDASQQGLGRQDSSVAADEQHVRRQQARSETAAGTVQSALPQHGRTTRADQMVLGGAVVVESPSIEQQQQQLEPVFEGQDASTSHDDDRVWDEGVNRRALVPANPNARIGNKYETHRPIKHGRRVRMKREMRWAAEEQAPW